MEILKHDAAHALFDKIETLRYQPHDSWRAVYIKLSDKPANSDSALHTHFVASTVMKVLADTEGYIYLCKDGDIFILFQNTLKSVVSRLSSYLGEIDCAPLRGRHQESLFFFNLGKQWEGFHKLCETKYLEALAAAEETRGDFVPHTYVHMSVLQQA